MYETLKHLFESNGHLNLVGVLNTINGLATGLENAIGRDHDKINQALDIVKEIVEQHKKP